MPVKTWDFAYQLIEMIEYETARQFWKPFNQLKTGGTHCALIVVD